jgi:hypothetical protein
MSRQYWSNIVCSKSYIGPIVVPPSTTPTPTWLVGQPINTWIPVNDVSTNGSKLITMTDLSAQVAAGLCDSSFNLVNLATLDGATHSPAGHPTGNPRQRIFAYSGGALKVDGSEMLIFGGGGAGAYAGNDIRGFRLEDNVPTWKTRTTPTDVKQGGVPGTAGAGNLWTDTYNWIVHQYYRNGQPNARHSYRQLQFNDATNTAYLFGCSNSWEFDTGTMYGVDHVPLQLGVPWTPGTDDTHSATPGYVGINHPNIPEIDTNFGWVQKNSNTGEVYYPGADKINSFNPTTNTWTLVMGRSDGVHGNMPSTGTGRAITAYDSNHNRMLRISWSTSHGGSGVHSTIDLNGSKSWITATLSDVTSGSGYAAAITNNNSNGCGLVYDPVLNKYLYFMDDQLIYTITYVSGSSYVVDLLFSTPAPFPAGCSVLDGGTVPAAIWSRMQYIPNLKGVAFVLASNQPVYFVRTA